MQYWTLTFIWNSISDNIHRLNMNRLALIDFVLDILTKCTPTKCTPSYKVYPYKVYLFYQVYLLQSVPLTKCIPFKVYPFD